MRECGTGKINPASDLSGGLSVSDEDRTEVFKLATTLQWLTIKQAGLALLTRDECCNHLSFQSVNVPANCCGMAINYVKLSLVFPCNFHFRA